MSDKELDKLFKSDFESFEVEPSAGLWDKIDAELSAAPNQQKKKVYPVFLMAAASVIIVIAAGLYFMQPQQTIKLHRKETIRIVKNTPMNSVEQPVETKVPMVVAVPAIEKKKEERYGKSAPLARIYKTVKTDIDPVNITDESGAVTDDMNINASRALAVNTAPVNTLTIQPDMTSQVNSSRTMPKTTAIAMLNNQQKPLGADIQHESSKRKIKSLGDLVNRVIAEVDPREDKIIQFTNNDEGTEVSGINLGLIKFKHNHK